MLGQPFTIPGQAPGVQGTRLCHLLSDEALLRRLSGNTGEDCVSALRALNLPDSFWTDEFKVVPCAKTYSHKWTLCPCAHIGETARRRCPRSVNYKAVLCPLVKAKKTCPLGDSCSYAHNVFEHWLHPSRYKTRLCSFGRNCNRSICFFAHSAEELRCVPCTDDKEGDEREYLMQIIMAQENGLLPPSAMEQMQPAPMPPLMQTMMPDLGSALQHALQQPLPPSNRASMNGLPDTAAMMSTRASMSGMPELLSARASLSGLQDASAAVFRASMSGVQAGSGMMMPGRPSLNGLPERATFMQARTSMNGLNDGNRARPSLNGIPDHANMLLSMSVQGSMQRAMSNDVNSAFNAAGMQRAMSNDLGGNAFTTASMQHAMSGELASAPLNAAAAAMERALSREFAAGGASPLQSAAVAAMERAYPQRDALGGGGPNAMERAMMNSRSLSSSARRELSSLAHTPSINSVESDSLIQVRGGNMAGLGPGVSAGNTAHGGGGFCGGFSGGHGFDAMTNPQAPPRLSDPGASFQVPMPHGYSSMHAHHSRMSDSGNKAGMLCSKDLAGLESLLPLVNNALASGALSLPPHAMRRSNSGSNSGRVLSPPLQENAGSPLHSGSMTPQSTNSAGEAVSGEAAYQHHQALMQAAGSPPTMPESTSYEGMLQAAQAAAAAAAAGNLGGANGGGSGVDQSYLTDLVARLQDHGVNKEQLVSSLSQLLAQLLSVSN